MNPSAPPPLPTEAAWRTYVRSAVSLFPAFAAWVFASLFLQARLEMVWREAGLVGSRAQWLMSISDAFHHNFRFICLAVVLVIIVLELPVRVWPRYRRTVIFSATVLLNTAVFVWVLTLATAALLAAPLLANHK